MRERGCGAGLRLRGDGWIMEQLQEPSLPLPHGFAIGERVAQPDGRCAVHTPVVAKKEAPTGRLSECRDRSVDQLDAFTSNERVDTGFPSSAICTVYLPAGQAFGFWILNVVTAGPEVAMDWLIALTSWPLPSS